MAAGEDKALVYLYARSATARLEKHYEDRRHGRGNVLPDEGLALRDLQTLLPQLQARLTDPAGKRSAAQRRLASAQALRIKAVQVRRVADGSEAAGQEAVRQRVRQFWA